MESQRSWRDIREEDIQDKADSRKTRKSSVKSEEKSSTYTTQKVRFCEMPFRKISQNRYVSPSGKKYTRKQVKLYYATKGKWK